MREIPLPYMGLFPPSQIRNNIKKMEYQKISWIEAWLPKNHKGDSPNHCTVYYRIHVPINKTITANTCELNANFWQLVASSSWDRT